MTQIGCELESEDGIVQLKMFTNVLPDRRVSRQFEQSAMVIAELEFAR